MYSPVARFSGNNRFTIITLRKKFRRHKVCLMLTLIMLGFESFRRDHFCTVVIPAISLFDSQPRQAKRMHVSFTGYFSPRVTVCILLRRHAACESCWRTWLADHSTCMICGKTVENTHRYVLYVFERASSTTVCVRYAERQWRSHIGTLHAFSTVRLRPQCA